MAWPLAARTQQAVMPVIGFLSPTSPEANVDRLPGFRQGEILEGALAIGSARWTKAEQMRVLARTSRQGCGEISGT